MKYNWQVGQTPPELDTHSSAKHSVYRYYLRRYINVLCSDPRYDGLNLTLIDGFAGGGVYLRNGQPAPGSPMILLEEIADAEARFAQERIKPFRLNAEFIFIERDGANYLFLEDTIRRSSFAAGLGTRVNLVEDTFETALPRIIQRIKARGRAQRCIFFLDQFGYKQVSFDTVRTILANVQKPEIILTFAVDHLIDYPNNSPKFIEAVRPVELSVQHIQELISIKDQREARWVIQNFLYAHLVNQTEAPYYTCFFIKSSESHRSYWLVHISKHPKARDEMALQHWQHIEHLARSAAKIATRRWVRLTPPRTSPCASPTGKTRGAQGCANSWRSAPPYSSNPLAASWLAAPLRGDPCVRSRTQESGRSGPNSAVLATIEAMSPWLLQIAEQKNGPRQSP